MGNQLNTCCAPCGADGKPLMAGDMEEVRKLGLQKSGAAELDEKVVHPHAPAHSRIRSAARF
jgi:hypothetical protein